MATGGESCCADGKKKHITLLVVLGSPKEDGECACMIEHLISGVRHSCEKHGVELTVKPVVPLFARHIHPCSQCMKCVHQPTLPSCVLEDDMKTIMADLLEASIVVHAMPVWFWTMPGLLKLYMERWSQLFQLPSLTLREDAKKAMHGLTMAALANSGDPNHAAMCADSLRPWQRLAEFVPDTFRWAGAATASMGVAHNPEAQKRCHALGEACVETYLSPMLHCTVTGGPFHPEYHCTKA